MHREVCMKADVTVPIIVVWHINWTYASDLPCGRPMTVDMSWMPCVDRENSYIFCTVKTVECYGTDLVLFLCDFADKVLNNVQRSSLSLAGWNYHCRL